jgi:hypothetical protein
MRETFKAGELETLQKLRLSVPGAPDAVQEICQRFNEQLSALLLMIRKFYADPLGVAGENVLSIDFATLLELGAVRREVAWQILQNVLTGLASRADAIREIDQIVAGLLSEARESQRKTRLLVEKKLADVLSGPELARAVVKSDDVVAADAELKRVVEMNTTLHGGLSNVAKSEAGRLGEAILSRIESFAAELGHIERMPSSDDSRGYTGSQFISSSVGAKRKPIVHREVLGPITD